MHHLPSLIIWYSSIVGKIWNRKNVFKKCYSNNTFWRLHIDVTLPDSISLILLIKCFLLERAFSDLVSSLTVFEELLASLKLKFSLKKDKIWNITSILIVSYLCAIVSWLLPLSKQNVAIKRIPKLLFWELLCFILRPSLNNMTG